MLCKAPYFLKQKHVLLLLSSDANAPFAQWSTERVCAWLEDFGLAQYVIFARQWVTSGHTLLTATPQDMEKVRTGCEVELPYLPPGQCMGTSARVGDGLHLPHTHRVNREGRGSLLLCKDLPPPLRTSPS